MPPQSITPMRKAWLRWKSLKLPWRKRFLVGLDLDGNTFWEFKDAITSNRMRRIVQYPRETQYSEIKISPQWHQWLRHTRHEPPSLTEQSQDLVRQEQLKILAARADARWAAKPGYMDAPARQQALPATAIKDPRGYVQEAEESGASATADNAKVDASNSEPVLEATEATETAANRPGEKKRSRIKEQPEKVDPWKQARGGPSEEWQPTAWSGGTAARRR